MTTLLLVVLGVCVLALLVGGALTHDDSVGVGYVRATATGPVVIPPPVPTPPCPHEWHQVQGTEDGLALYCRLCGRVDQKQPTERQT